MYIECALNVQSSLVTSTLNAQLVNVQCSFKPAWANPSHVWPHECVVCCYLEPTCSYSVLQYEWWTKALVNIWWGQANIHHTHSVEASNVHSDAFHFNAIVEVQLDVPSMHTVQIPCVVFIPQAVTIHGSSLWNSSCLLEYLFMFMVCKYMRNTCMQAFI